MGAAEEITTELLAAEVVNTTTAGFTTGGLAETQDLSCGSDNRADDCVTEHKHGLEHFCNRCWTEGGSNPLRNRCQWCCTECSAWCSQSQDRCENYCNGAFCPGVGAVEAALAAGAFLLPVLPREGQQRS